MAFNGPPPVSGTTKSKSCSAPITEKKTDRRIIGASAGKVMYRNRCQSVGAVDLGRLEQDLVDALQAGDEQHHVEAEIFPHDHDEHRDNAQSGSASR